jgi:hypothetical protein
MSEPAFDVPDADSCTAALSEQFQAVIIIPASKNNFKNWYLIFIPLVTVVKIY